MKFGGFKGFTKARHEPNSSQLSKAVISFTVLYISVFSREKFSKFFWPKEEQQPLFTDLNVAFSTNDGSRPVGSCSGEIPVEDGVGKEIVGQPREVPIAVIFFGYFLWGTDNNRDQNDRQIHQKQQTFL